MHRDGSWILPWPSPFVERSYRPIGVLHPESTALEGRLSSSNQTTTSYPQATGISNETSTMPQPEVSVPAASAALQVTHGAALPEMASSMEERRRLVRQRGGNTALVTLARRYYCLRLVSVPFAQWHFRVVSKRPKRRNEETQRLCLALRSWRRILRRPRLGRSLVKVVLGRLRHAFLQLQQPALQRRLRLAKAMMLKILHHRTELRMAAVWWQQVHLRSAFLGWLEAMGSRRFGHLPAPPDVASVSSVDLASPFVLRGGSGGGEESSLVRSHQIRRRSGRSSREAQQEVNEGPLNFLLRVQQEGFRRWWRATCMDISAKELLLQRQRAAILVLLRQRTQHAMAIAHSLWSLLEKAFRGFSCGVSEDSDAEPRPCRASRASRHARHVAGRKNVERGLRGTSVGEVLRKGWRRWRYAVAVGHQVVAAMLHRPNVSLVLGEIASEIAGLRQVATGARRKPKKRAALPPPPEAKNTASPRAIKAEVAEPTHLIFLQKALAGFASRSAGRLEDMSSISLWPETSVATNVDLRQVLSPKQSFRNDERWPSFATELWSPPAGGETSETGYPPQRWEERAESWRRMLREADHLPPPPAISPSSARVRPEEAEASYEGLRRRALARLPFIVKLT